MPKDNRVTIRVTEAEQEAWGEKAVREIGWRAEPATIARRLMELWGTGPTIHQLEQLGQATPAKEGLVLPRENPYTFTASEIDRRILQRVENILQAGPAAARAAVVAILDLAEIIAEQKHSGDPDPVSELLKHSKAIQDLTAQQVGESLKEAAGNPPTKTSAAKPRKTGGARTA